MYECSELLGRVICQSQERLAKSCQQYNHKTGAAPKPPLSSRDSAA